MNRIVFRAFTALTFGYLVAGAMGCPSNSKGGGCGGGEEEYTDPSQYCDVGTVWDKARQKCVRSQ
jgi:hypothetical protein